MATISTVNGKKITKIKYKGEIYDTGGSGVNPLQHIIDNHKGDGKPSGEDLFYEYWGSSLDNVIPYCDFSKITSARQMFYDCKNLISVPYFDTSSCSNMAYMFCGCINLKKISQLDTRNVDNMGSMFLSCYKLTTIDITYMNITSTAYSGSFASSCYSLTKLIIRNMPTIPVLAKNSFEECYHFDGTPNMPYNPKGLRDGRIYVPDDKVEALKTATNWSVYADIIVPLSTLVE